MNWKNSITDLLNIQYPLIQSPMFGVTTPQMTAASSNAGCLGSLPLADLSPENCIKLINDTQKLTDQPFAVNIFVNEVPEIDDKLTQQYFKAKTFIEHLANENGLHVALPELNTLKITDYHDQIEAIISQKCKILSFIFGCIDDQSIALLKKNNIFLIGTCTCVEEAKILSEKEIDIICVQGIEAGGHRGSFKADKVAQIGGLSLLSQVAEKVKNPLIYAGGIYNAKTLLAAKTLGAAGVQVGSLLLGATESALKPFEKNHLKRVKEEDIMLTKSFSGRYARGIKNKFIEIIEHSEYVLPYPYQNKLTHELRKAAKEKELADFVGIWLGQSINGFSDKSTTELLKGLIQETEDFYKN
ncbi:NAD(P)H-dependent flavin oxidoreductase [Flavobacterium sp.]|uniref:NAD(P)H-dependent flavin oxidoreductase n=1 Tax=Flavobacterium sp. TaxID=239 RepID=UPI003D0C614B